MFLSYAKEIGAIRRQILRIVGDVLSAEDVLFATVERLLAYGRLRSLAADHLALEAARFKSLRICFFLVVLLLIIVAWATLLVVLPLLIVAWAALLAAVTAP